MGLPGNCEAVPGALEKEVVNKGSIQVTAPVNGAKIIQLPYYNMGL